MTSCSKGGQPFDISQSGNAEEPLGRRLGLAPIGHIVSRILLIDPKSLSLLAPQHGGVFAQLLRTGRLIASHYMLLRGPFQNLDDRHLIGICNGCYV